MKVTSPSFCTTASERVYITANAVKLDSLDPEAKGRRRLEPCAISPENLTLTTADRSHDANVFLTTEFQGTSLEYGSPDKQTARKSAFATQLRG